jgi:RHS repeat-associated protein
MKHAFAFLLCLAAYPASAATVPITELYGFTKNTGDAPSAPLMRASDGNLYGTTSLNGCASACYGTVFMMTIEGQITVLHTFVSGSGDGTTPSGLAEGPDGYLYGTTASGGLYGTGTIFKVSKTGQFQKIYDFCNTNSHCIYSWDGSSASALTPGNDGDLYGTTAISNGQFRIYKISPSGTITRLFLSGAGYIPSGGLFLASDGNFYGGTNFNLYRMTPAGKVTVLHNFAGGANDGSEGASHLIQASDGNMYGVTHLGGAYGAGVVFRLGLDGSYQKFFDIGGPVHGRAPHALIQASDGNLWGTTERPNQSGTGGVVYTITTAGVLVQSTPLTLATGDESVAALVQGGDGRLYGTASESGTQPNGSAAGGTVFVVDAGLPGPVTSGKALGFCTCKPYAGDPITIATGNLVEQVLDYQTAGPNRLGFTRFYNSLAVTGPATFASALGVNWRGTFDRYIRINSNTSVSAERADGQILNFTPNGGVWAPDSDIDLKLTQTGSGVGSAWTLTDRDDTVETYTTISANEAVLSSIQVRSGYTQNLQYDANNLLQKVTDSFGRTLQFTYQSGLLSSVTTPDGLVLTYSYAAAGGSNRLVSVAYSTSPATSQTYLYENTSYPFALTGIMDENGNRYATWAYDAGGRATSSQLAGGTELTTISYNDADGSRTVTGPLSQQTVYKFTVLQGIPKVTEEDRLATSTTAAATRAFTYDANGYLASRSDWNGNLTTFVNDVHGQPLSITEAPGTAQARTTTMAYLSNYHLPSQIVTPGLTTAFVYDSIGNLLPKTLTDTTTETKPYSTNGTKRTWTYSWSNLLLASVKIPTGGTTAYSYDGTGALIKVTDALSHITQITKHLPGGWPQTILDPNSVTTTLTYDPRLRLTSSAVTTGAGPLTTTFAWDAAGNLLSVTLPDGSKLTNAYDAAHRLTSVTDLFSQKTAYILDALGDRTQTNVSNTANAVKRTRSDTFDALGRLRQDTGGAGQVTKYAYDNNGNSLTVTDPLSRMTSQAFDPLNRLFKVTDPTNGVATTTFDAHDRILSVTAPNGAVTSYVYDGFGDPIQVTSPDTGTTVYRYDPAGNLTQKVDAANATTNYTYDALNRVLTTTYPADAAENVTYTYDQAGHGFGVGRLTSVTDAVGTLNRTYDERGNLLSESRVHGTVTLLTSYTFDAAGRIASVTYPSGALVTNARDAMGRITGVTLKPKGAATAQTVASGIAYQPFGPASAFTFGNGVAETRSFDLDYRLTGLAGTGSGAIQNLTYGYNAADNVLSIGDAVHSANSQTFGYDALDRLITASGTYGSLAYTYDPAGNRLTQQAGTTVTTYSYTANSNRLTQIKTGSTAQALSTTAAGNISAWGTLGITYNQANRLATALSGAQQIQYTYDGFGHRLMKVGTLSATTRSQYDQSGHLLEQTDGSGNAQADYVYLGDRPLATFQPSNGKLYFLHDDRLGTPQGATDSTKAVVWSASYEPFGYTATGIGAIVQDLRLPGQEFEVETGWNHNGFRDYAPTLGRYLESDPIGLAGGANTYAYIDANPISSYDMLGLADTSSRPTGVDLTLPQFSFIQALLPAHTAMFAQCPIGGSTDAQLEYAKQINSLRMSEVKIATIGISPPTGTPLPITLAMKNLPQLFLKLLPPFPPLEAKQTVNVPPNDNWGQPGGCGDAWCLIYK